MDLNKKYPCVKAPNSDLSGTKSIPYKADRLLDWLEDIPNIDKKIEIVSWVLYQLNQAKYSEERWWLDDKYKNYEEQFMKYGNVMSEYKIQFKRKRITEANSFGTTNVLASCKEKEDILLEANVKVEYNKQDKEYQGYWECYLVEPKEMAQENDWFATGNLFFEKKNLVDFDGEFSIADEILDHLDKKGFNTSDVR